jgi:glucose-6-phosphate isomerase
MASVTAELPKLTSTSPLRAFGVDIDLIEGTMLAPDRVLTRRASDMRGYYADEAALQRLIDASNPVHYEVFEKVIPEVDGELLFCISKLYPGTVGDECFMTKGHYHTRPQTAETYLCIRGEGFMAMKTAEGLWDTQEMRRNRMVYVPGFWAHRSINTGDEPLISFCVYPADAGHNYGDIEKEGFPRRIFKRGGKVEIR